MEFRLKRLFKIKRGKVLPGNAWDRLRGMSQVKKLSTSLSSVTTATWSFNAENIPLL